MPTPPTTRLRNLAATLMSVSGAGHITSLWFRPLDNQALFALLVGAVYVLIGIGLFGQSRFTLFVAMVIPAATSTLLLQHYPAEQLHELQLAGLFANVMVVLASALVLWRVRNDPSV